MGANFNMMILKGTTTRDKVTKVFTDARQSDLHQHGHDPYAGTWGVVPNIAFPQDKTFDSEDAAYDWLMDNCEKWEEALCVTFKKNKRAKRTQWMMGAWCAS